MTNKYQYLVEDAIVFATEKHSGQMDKAGVAYIVHPLTVMSRMQTDLERIVAVLHDVLEDTDATYFQLVGMFGEEVANSVEALTKKSGETYDLYLEKVKKDKIAKKVKIEDIKHNMDMSRIPKPKQADYDRLRKYDKALRKLGYVK